MTMVSPSHTPRTENNTNMMSNPEKHQKQVPQLKMKEYVDLGMGPEGAGNMLPLILQMER